MISARGLPNEARGAESERLQIGTDSHRFEAGLKMIFIITVVKKEKDQ